MTLLKNAYNWLTLRVSLIEDGCHSRSTSATPQWTFTDTELKFGVIVAESHS